MARNPVRPDTLAVAGRIDTPFFSCALHISSDGGASWSLASRQAHQAYVDKANAAPAGTGLEDAPARDILTRLTEFPPDRRDAVRNNVGGHLDHSLFWESMTPDSTGTPRRTAS